MQPRCGLRKIERRDCAAAEKGELIREKIWNHRNRRCAAGRAGADRLPRGGQQLGCVEQHGAADVVPCLVGRAARVVDAAIVGGTGFVGRIVRRADLGHRRHGVGHGVRAEQRRIARRVRICEMIARFFAAAGAAAFFDTKKNLRKEALWYVPDCVIHNTDLA